MPTPRTIQLSQAVKRSARQLNRSLSTRHEIDPKFLMPYVDVERQLWGRRGLITCILLDRGSVLPATTTDRRLEISASTYTGDILSEVKTRWSQGSKSYPKESIQACLNHDMIDLGFIRRVQLTEEEDVGRRCPRPRCKWYLIS